MVKTWAIVLLLNGIYSLFEYNCEGSIPLTDGNWLTPSRGTWTVNSTTIAGFSSSLSLATPTSTLSFVSNSGTLYLFSTSVVIFGVAIPFYTCLDLQVSSAPIFYIVTANNETVGDRFTGTSDEACSNTGYQTVDNRNILIQQGAETSITSTLPDVIRGEYSVNFTSTSGVTSDSVTLDACTDTTVLRFNDSSTNQNVGFSSDGYLTSIYSIQSDTVVYLYTYNNDSTVDDTSTYRITCWVISSSSFGALASAYPGVCQNDQNATYTPAGGQLFTLTASLTCASTDDDSGSDNTVIIIIIVIVVCVVIVVIILIIFIVWFVKKKSKKKTADDVGLQQETCTRDVSVATATDTGDDGSFCIPWMGKGTKTISTSTTDLSSIMFYLPLKYTKRPGDMNNGASTSKRPKIIHRSKTSLSALDESPETNTTKTPRRFVQYVGVIKKDTQTKPVVNSHWPNGTAKPLKNQSKEKESKSKEMVSNPVKIQDELKRSKTFHDFEKEFEEKNKFPVSINGKVNKENIPVSINGKVNKENIPVSINGKVNKENIPVSINGKVNKENKTMKHVTIGNAIEIKQNPPTTKTGILRVRSQEELDRIPDETKECDDNKATTVVPKGSFRRTKSLPPTSRSNPGKSYRSPYAMTKEQREYFAKRRAWASLQHNHEEAKQNWLRELKKKESENAYKNWIRTKTMVAEQMRVSFTHNKS